MSYVAIAVVVMVGVLVLALRIRRAFGPLRAGDFFKVDIPRTLDKPLAIGTRLDIGSALKKSGVSRDELRVLLDGDHDRELVEQYWRHKDLATAKVV